MGLILVASEDAVEIETIKAALSVHGWWVTVATDRASAIQAAADQAPKLVLIDYELPGSTELVRAFGSSNGGPGALVCVADGFDSALELKEAGADELITKPLSPPGLLEVVRRCLAAPRPAEVERSAPAQQLLTTEEIFGDVLRELEGDRTNEVAARPVIPNAPAPSPVAAAEAARTASFAELAAPSPAPAFAGPDDPFESPPAKRPVVSLAGLFDEEPETAAPADWESKWTGEERRSPERPWNPGAESSRLPAIDELFADSPVFEASPAPSRAGAPALETPFALAPDADDVELRPEADPPPEEVALETPEAAEPVRRLPRTAVALGALAASLLVAAGVVFLKNPGSEATATPGLIVEPVERPGLNAEPQTLEPEAAEDRAVAAAAAPVAAPVEPPASPSANAVAAAPAIALDLEALVEEELERREEGLRQVFLEEEKRLLRELKKLDESPPAGEDDGVDDPPDGGR